MCNSDMSTSSFQEEPKKHASSRRSNKPLMEKRRRERINRCLSQLKLLVLQAMKKDSTHYSKLEKADILEMTVKHLKAIQRQQLMASVAVDSSVMSKYMAGYNECAMEVSRYMESVQGVNPEVKTRVLDHLAGCVSQSLPSSPIENQKRQEIPIMPSQTTPRVAMVHPQRMQVGAHYHPYQQQMINSRLASQYDSNAHQPHTTQGQVTVVTQQTFSVPPSPSTSPSSCSDASYEYDEDQKHMFSDTSVNHYSDNHIKIERQWNSSSTSIDERSYFGNTANKLVVTGSIQPKSDTDSSNDNMWRPW